MVIILLFISVAVLLLVDYLISKAEKASNKANTLSINIEVPVFNKNSFDLESGFILSKKHIWFKSVTTQRFIIGADDFIQKAVGDYKYIVHKTAFDIVKKNDVVFSIEAADNIINFYAPCDMMITAINEAPARINNNKKINWVMEVEPNEPLANVFFDSKEAKKWLHQEFAKLKDFIAFQYFNPEYELATLHDGGQIVEGALLCLNQNAISEFENEFLKS